MQDRYFTDEELTAFLDGEDALAPVAEIEAALKTDAALATRLDALRIDTDEIQRHFAPLLPKADDHGFLLNMPPVRTGFGSGVLALAAAAALVIGVSIGSWTSTPKLNGWTEYVAAYQALYSNSTLAHLDQSTPAKQAELTRVTAAINKTIPLSALESFMEVEYKRAQILSFEGRALIQLAFTTSTGEPMALCIIQSNAGRSSSPEVATMEGLSSATWASENYEYLLIGGTDDALVSRVATQLVSQSI